MKNSLDQKGFLWPSFRVAPPLYGSLLRLSILAPLISFLVSDSGHQDVCEANEERRRARKQECRRERERPRRKTLPMVRNAWSSAMRMKWQATDLSMALSGTMDTPMRAPTILIRLLNWPLSNAICGWTRARSQAATAVSRKQWPSRRRRNGSERRSLSKTEERLARR